MPHGHNPCAGCRRYRCPPLACSEQHVEQQQQQQHCHQLPVYGMWYVCLWLLVKPIRKNLEFAANELHSVFYVRTGRDCFGLGHLSSSCPARTLMSITVFAATVTRPCSSALLAKVVAATPPSTSSTSAACTLIAAARSFWMVVVVMSWKILMLIQTIIRHPPDDPFAW